MKHSAQVEALAGFLDVIDFKYFCTFTTRRPISLNSTRRIAESVGKFIHAGSLSTYFWAAEPFDVREGFHFHALIATPFHSLEIFNWYFPRYGRCQIINNQEPDRKRSASFYCSKYVTKKVSDYDLYLDNSLRNREQVAINFPFISR